MASTDSTSISGSSSTLSTMVYQLMASDRIPLNLLQTRKADLQARDKSISALTTRLSSLLTLARNLNLPGRQNPLQAQIATSGDSSVLEATAAGISATGTHTVEVLRLASRQVLASSNFDPEDRPASLVSSRSATEYSFQITAGGKDVVVDLSLSPDATYAAVLDAVAAAVNAAGGPVTASVMDVGGGTSRLLLTAASSGVDAGITQIRDRKGSLMGLLGLSGSEEGTGSHPAVVRAAEDALFKVDGITVTAADNVVSTALPGLTLTLKGVSQDPIQVGVAADADAVVKQIQEFVTEYNKALEEVRSQTQPADENGQNRGTLAGDQTIARLRRALRETLSRSVGSGAGSVQSLAEIGVTADREGKLTLSDEEALRAAVEEDSAGVVRLFRGDDGIGARLTDLLQVYSKTGGVLGRQAESGRRQMQSLNTRIAQTNQSLARRQQALTDQLSGLQAMIGTLSLQQQYLSGLLSSSDQLYL